ncbi:MAG: LysR family transcriptional regulator [Proteobacteria bacterium]|jgi:LysR family transcriptional regulator for metE and metH|nr:LysR family transcriptional regulator [Pseudomonadota bacterium]MDA0960630.1 LysR family transcriptional regulator [Pseudomonadota bacterium]MDA1151656.1 LysR family transcriptional regulator [Pseudomonadota bacterium]
MNIELRHLRTIMAIHSAGSVAQAAEQLHITQSALSHQIKAIRDQLGVDLFVKNTKPMRLSAEGLRFLRAAERILPEIDLLKAEFDNLQRGEAGRLHIAIECHACFEWLFPVLNLFRQDYPDVDIDIRPGLAFRALKALVDEEVDIVISSDPEDIPGVEFHQLFPYAPTFLAATANPLSRKDYVDAQDFSDQTLITYPVERTRLDIFSQLLIPAKIEPKLIRQVELTAVMLMLVGANKGVAVLPDWVIRSADVGDGLVTLPVTKQGLVRQLYAAVRRDDEAKPFMERFIALGKEGQAHAKRQPLSP